MAAQVINVVQSGGYTVRGMLIITNNHAEIAKAIMKKSVVARLIYMEKGLTQEILKKFYMLF